MTAAGGYRERVRFERPAPDPSGDARGAWSEVITMAARIQPLKGAEPVLEQRLQGVQPVVIYVRACAASRGLDNACRAVNVRSGQVYDIKSAVLAEARDEVQLLAEGRMGDVVNG